MRRVKPEDKSKYKITQGPFLHISFIINHGAGDPAHYSFPATCSKFHGRLTGNIQ